MRRRLGSLSVMILAGWGCGPPQATPMLPPGYVPPPVASEGMESQGEVRSRGVMEAANSPPAQPVPKVQGEGKQ